MKALLQRVKKASVNVDGKDIANIDRGILVFLGIKRGDDKKDIDYLVEKIRNLRIFEGENNKLDLSIEDIKGDLLLVSQFTLYGTVDKGRRPDFGNAAPIEEAKKLYEDAVKSFKQTGLRVEEGEFQANMKVKLVNEGPLTLLVESKK